MTDKFLLHEYSASGNCYKVRLTAAMVGVPLERREYDIMKGETRRPVFLERVNPNGRIPVLQVGTRFIPESNAACFYLADGTPLIPGERFERADMLRWMFWEQYNHEPNIATLRFWIHEIGIDNLTEMQRALVPGKREGGNAALKLMEDHLSRHDWLVADRVSLADVCLFAYTHVAGDADFRLSDYPHVSKWIGRFQAQSNYLPISA